MPGGGEGNIKKNFFRAKLGSKSLEISREKNEFLPNNFISRLSTNNSVMNSVISLFISGEPEGFGKSSGGDH